MTNARYWDANLNDWVECESKQEEQILREKGYRFFGEYTKADDKRSKAKTEPLVGDGKLPAAVDKPVK